MTDAESLVVLLDIDRCAAHPGDELERRFGAAERDRCPAAHYVRVDDRPQILAGMKRQMGARLATVWVGGGITPPQPKASPSTPPPT